MKDVKQHGASFSGGGEGRASAPSRRSGDHVRRGWRRARRALIDAGFDPLVVDTAHGHSQRVLDAVTRVKKLSNSVRVVAGNVATREGAKALMTRAPMRSRSGLGRARSAPRGSFRASGCRNSPRSWRRRRPLARLAIIADGGVDSPATS